MAWLSNFYTLLLLEELMPRAGTFTTYEKIEQVCDNCLSKLEVTIPHQEGHEDSEDYICPVCEARYSVRASNSPEVHVLIKNVLL